MLCALIRRCVLPLTAPQEHRPLCCKQRSFRPPMQVDKASPAVALHWPLDEVSTAAALSGTLQCSAGPRTYRCMHICICIRTHGIHHHLCARISAEHSDESRNGCVCTKPVKCAPAKTEAIVRTRDYAHSTAQHSAAQHGTAQHSTAQHSTPIAQAQLKSAMFDPDRIAKHGFHAQTVLYATQHATNILHALPNVRRAAAPLNPSVAGGASAAGAEQCRGSA